MKDKLIVKILKLLLLRLGLWIPIAFSLLFLLVILISGTAFSDVSALFTVGLIVTAVFGITSSIALSLKRKEKRKAKSERTKRFVSAHGTDETEPGFTEGTPTPRSAVSREGAPAPERLFPTNEETETERQRRYEEPDRRVSERPGQGFAFGDGSRASDISQREERPRIFKTRMDENLLIYEYTDRLEFYRRENGRLTHLSTEYKGR